jgi:hypothetical protein
MTELPMARSSSGVSFLMAYIKHSQRISGMTMSNNKVEANAYLTLVYTLSAGKIMEGLRRKK